LVPSELITARTNDPNATDLQAVTVKCEPGFAYRQRLLRRPQERNRAARHDPAAGIRLNRDFYVLPVQYLRAFKALRRLSSPKVTGLINLDIDRGPLRSRRRIDDLNGLEPDGFDHDLGLPENL